MRFDDLPLGFSTFISVNKAAGKPFHRYMLHYLLFCSVFCFRKVTEIINIEIKRFQIEVLKLVSQMSV